MVPGHEVVGAIGKVGDGVRYLRVGQVVGLGWHAGYCNECESCKTGGHNLCGTARATVVGHHGGITVFNPLVQFDIKPTDKVAVIGIGVPCITIAGSVREKPRRRCVTWAVRSIGFGLDFCAWFATTVLRTPNCASHYPY